MAPRKILKFFAPLALFPALASCGTAPSPAVQVTCSNVSLTVVTAGEFIQRIQQTVSATDPGLATQVILNDAEVTLYVDDFQAFDAVGVCAGGYETCSTAAAFKNTLTTKTNSQGILEVFVRLDNSAGASYSGSITEVFGGGSNVCKIDYSVSAG